MSESKRTSGAPFRTDRLQEQAVVHTLLLGGRPSGSDQRLGPIPRGIEVLIKKASIDISFKQSLFTERADAARETDMGTHQNHRLDRLPSLENLEARETGLKIRFRFRPLRLDAGFHPDQHLRG